MREIIHTSLSAQANHLTSHFYNAQSSYFVFDDSLINTRSFADPNILFRAGVGTDNKTKTFTPRSILWDMRGGFGALKKSNPLYDYDSHKSLSELNAWSQQDSFSTTDPSKMSNTDGLIKQTQVEVSEYQKALDSGNPSPSLLNTFNTRYWSDYVNIYFNPRLSFHTIPNWQYDPVKAPFGCPRGDEPGPDTRKFLSYETGISEFQAANNLNDDSTYIEDTLRPIIEECDSVAGLNFFTELDTSWGAFTAKVVEEFREDYVPKAPIFVYAICDNELTADKYSFDSRGRAINRVASLAGSQKTKEIKQQSISRIKTLTSLAASASLVIPISKPRNVSEKLKLYDSNSLWHSSALLSLPVETIILFSNLRGNKYTSMQTILDKLQNGSKRNIVSSIQSSIIRSPKKSNKSDTQAQEPLQTDFDFSASLFNGLETTKQDQYFSKIGTLRRDYGETIDPSATDSQTNAAILEYQRLIMSGNKTNTGPQSDNQTATELFDGLFRQRDMLDNGTPESGLMRLSCPQPLATPSSFPCKALEIADYSKSIYMSSVECKQIDGPDAVYASMGITSRPRLYLKNFEKTIAKFTRNSDDGIEELKDDTAALVEEYEWGWQDDDDFFDDD